MKTTNVILASAFLKRFYATAFPNAKEASALKKKVERYEDVSYLHDQVGEETRALLEKEYLAAIENEKKHIKETRDFLKSLQNEHINPEKALEKKELKQPLTQLKKLCEETALASRLVLATRLYEFPGVLNNVLDRYFAKANSEEYLDLEAFHKEFKGLFDETFEVLDQIEEALSLEGPQYVERVLHYVDECSNVLFQEQSHGPFRIPDWAKGVLFCAPWIIGFLVFTLYPLIQTIIFSFSNVSLSTEGFKTTWAGWTNYANVFTSDTDFLIALKNYLIQMLVYVPLITIFSLMLAMLLNTNIKGRGFFRVIFFFPVIITSGPVIKILLEQGVTAMPGLTNLFDIETMTASLPDFLRTAINILTSEFVMILWFSGIQILVFLTALQKIDKSVYEASAIDGANRWEQFWKVTLPAVNSSIVINVVFTTVMQSIFALNPIILKIQADMNDTAEGKGYGYSSALAFSYFLVMIVVLVVFVLIFMRKGRGRRAAK